MSVRPFRDIKRKKTKVINVGDVKIGGDNPISVQSMTNTLTTDIKATINQINDIAVEVFGTDQGPGSAIVITAHDDGTAKVFKVDVAAVLSQSQQI